MSLRASSSAVFFLVASATLFSLLSQPAFAQTTISTGSVQGTITDQSGAVVGGARVTITNKGTGQAITVQTTSAGAYASGALIPGDYDRSGERYRDWEHQAPSWTGEPSCRGSGFYSAGQH